MKICQFFLPGRGKRVGVVRDDRVVDITSPREGVACALDLVVKGGSGEGVTRLAARLAQGRRAAFAFADLDRAPSPRHPHLLAPLDPPEVWGAGITYRRSADYYTAHGETGRTKGIYDYVYEAKRPELFFKATAARCAGPNGALGVRGDSALTAVEPELAVVIGTRGRIVGFTAGNDCSAWDIERENPLYLPQSKVFDGCFALGPVIATTAAIPDPHALELGCRILRDRRTVYQGRVSTGEMKRRCRELVEWLARNNTIPPGTVLSTGTGILVPDEFALRDGDVVEIELESVGVLRNRARKLR